MSTSVLSEGSRRAVRREVGVPDDSVREQADIGGVRIRKSIPERVGYTAGCPKCKATELENVHTKKTSHHTSECRQ